MSAFEPELSIDCLTPQGGNNDADDDDDDDDDVVENIQ